MHSSVLLVVAIRRVLVLRKLVEMNVIDMIYINVLHIFLTYAHTVSQSHIQCVAIARVCCCCNYL